MSITHVHKSPNPASESIAVGHVHLKASNLTRIKAFYVDILGFSVSAEYPQAVFLTSDDYHHTLAFNTWTSKNGPHPTDAHTGLYHVALRYSTRRGLADALKRLMDADYQLDGLSDHGTHQALYLRDPEENGLELYWDRPQEDWPVDANGHLIMTNEMFRLEGLLAELNGPNKTLSPTP